MADEHNVNDMDTVLDELQEKAKKEAEMEASIVKKPVFTLDLDLDSEYGEAVEGERVVRETTIEPEESFTAYNQRSVHTEEKQDTPSGNFGCFQSLLYAIFVLVGSVLLSCLFVITFLDYTGLGRTERVETIMVPSGASTEEVTELLKEHKMISYPFIFRAYSKLNGADGKWQPGEFELSPNMGYNLLIESLQATEVGKNTVTVLIPEGFTVAKIAARLEENKVCTKDEFYRALTEVDYSTEYLFIKESQAAEGYEQRVHKMEGFLFPDTYQFLEHSSGEKVVRKFLDNFGNRLDTTVRSAMSARDLSMNELIVLASVVQGEAASRDDMQKVARVLLNRLRNPAYPKLQCDSTRDYIKLTAPSDTAAQAAYDTYVKDGLPAGPINNPGMDAINAVLVPSENETIMECYYFATDYDTGITYFSKTYEQHVSICKRYGIGMYG